jgi:hypothetical protein
LSELWTATGDPTLAVRTDRVRELGRLLIGDPYWERHMYSAGAVAVTDERIIEHVLGIQFHADAVNANLMARTDLDPARRQHAEVLTDAIETDRRIHAPARRALFDELAAAYLSPGPRYPQVSRARAGRVLALVAATLIPDRDVPRLVAVTFPGMATAFLATPQVGLRRDDLPEIVARRLRGTGPRT